MITKSKLAELKKTDWSSIGSPECSAYAESLVPDLLLDIETLLEERDTFREMYERKSSEYEKLKNENEKLRRVKDAVLMIKNAPSGKESIEAWGVLNKSLAALEGKE